jgi:hypothetical protein
MAEEKVVCSTSIGEPFHGVPYNNKRRKKNLKVKK